LGQGLKENGAERVRSKLGERKRQNEKGRNLETGKNQQIQYWDERPDLTKRKEKRPRKKKKWTTQKW